MLIGTNILIYSDVMARVTIEDCLKRIDNAYDVCTLASQRAKDILDGSEPKIDYQGKPSVVALKEIAEGLIDMTYLETRRKQQIEDQLSDAIAEEEAIADITAESQQITKDDDDNVTDSSNNVEVAPEESSDQSPENTEDKPL